MDKITLKIDEIKSIQKNPKFYLANYFNYLKRKVNSAFFENQKQLEIINRINLFEKDLNNKTVPFNSFNHEIQLIEHQLTKNDFNINKTLKSIDEIKYKIEKKLFSNKSCIFFRNQFLLIINDEFLRKNTIEFVSQITENFKKENLLAHLLIEKLNQINSNTSSNVLTIDIEAFKQIKINLSFKQIKSIDCNTLTGLKSLQVLHLNDNQILELNNEIIFNGLTSLKEINFSKNQINQTWFECIATLNESSGIYSFAISGKTLLMSGHIDGSIQIRNQSSFVLLQTLKQHSSEVWSIILLNNENLASKETFLLILCNLPSQTPFNLNKE